MMGQPYICTLAHYKIRIFLPPGFYSTTHEAILVGQSTHVSALVVYAANRMTRKSCAWYNSIKKSDMIVSYTTATSQKKGFSSSQILLCRLEAILVSLSIHLSALVIYAINRTIRNCDIVAYIVQSNMDDGIALCTPTTSQENKFSSYHIFFLSLWPSSPQCFSCIHP